MVSYEQKIYLPSTPRKRYVQLLFGIEDRCAGSSIREARRMATFLPRKASDARETNEPEQPSANTHNEWNIAARYRPGKPPPLQNKLGVRWRVQCLRIDCASLYVFQQCCGESFPLSTFRWLLMLYVATSESSHFQRANIAYIALECNNHAQASARSRYVALTEDTWEIGRTDLVNWNRKYSTLAGFLTCKCRLWFLSDLTQPMALTLCSYFFRISCFTCKQTPRLSSRDPHTDSRNMCLRMLDRCHGFATEGMKDGGWPTLRCQNPSTKKNKMGKKPCPRAEVSI